MSFKVVVVDEFSVGNKEKGVNETQIRVGYEKYLLFTINACQTPIFGFDVVFM